MSKSIPKTITAAFDTLTFKSDRTPQTQDMSAAFCELAPYRDGAVFLAHWAGERQWEVHRNGDEIVMVLEGATTISLLENGEERTHSMQAGELIVVPKDVWHRFQTPDEVKVLSVTPQPTEHSIATPAE